MIIEQNRYNLNTKESDIVSDLKTTFFENG